MNQTKSILQNILMEYPSALAELHGDQEHSKIQGHVAFYRVPDGTAVLAEVSGLPVEQDGCPAGFMGFHIHEGKSCTGTAEEPFSAAGEHYNPGNCPHPSHAGDLPVLLNNKGYAWMMFFTDRFTPEEIRGKTVIIHADPDDYKSQPGGAAGRMIACGEII